MCVLRWGISLIVPTLQRGNAACDALRHRRRAGRGASGEAFPRRAWERSDVHVLPTP
ncbi:DUF1534 domain-containing protein [Pseudomonas cavernicola]|uniref:DUF1534 domain-containing protein n=1 Tax=Pseudomonas cavernicola TaxID=2320866 RepID=A0A418XIT2_9PSED|nr:DUF1534 domain-containing protein [Pseudomonas cavernicola]